jgi:hypothetical protein
MRETELFDIELLEGKGVQVLPNPRMLVISADS